MEELVKYKRLKQTQMDKRDFPKKNISRPV